MPRCATWVKASAPQSAPTQAPPIVDQQCLDLGAVKIPKIAKLWFSMCNNAMPVACILHPCLGLEKGRGVAAVPDQPMNGADSGCSMTSLATHVLE
eukprot:4545791-Amphidinium_carterae.1